MYNAIRFRRGSAQRGGMAVQAPLMADQIIYFSINLHSDIGVPGVLLVVEYTDHRGDLALCLKRHDEVDRRRGPVERQNPHFYVRMLPCR